MLSIENVPGATLDPTALNPSTPAPQQTQPPPTTTPTTP